MAKKKKVSARRVVRRARKVAGKIDIMGIALANAGGFGAAFAIDKIDDQDFVVDKETGVANPFIAPLIVEAVGIVGSMFLPEKMKPAAYGVMGGAAAQLYRPIMDKINEDEPANGTSTINATKIASIVNRLKARTGGNARVPATAFTGKRSLQQGGASRMGNMPRQSGMQGRTAGRSTTRTNAGGYNTWRVFDDGE